jgi:hypothetical protein
MRGYQQESEASHGKVARADPYKPWWRNNKAAGRTGRCVNGESAGRDAGGVSAGLNGQAPGGLCYQGWFRLDGSHCLRRYSFRTYVCRSFTAAWDANVAQTLAAESTSSATGSRWPTFVQLRRGAHTEAAQEGLAPRLSRSIGSHNLRTPEPCKRSMPGLPGLELPPAGPH